jgi:hypothetical protein
VVGRVVGRTEGVCVGTRVGVSVGYGVTMGARVGLLLGSVLGACEGSFVGRPVGPVVGVVEGAVVGGLVGVCGRQRKQKIKLSGSANRGAIVRPPNATGADEGATVRGPLPLLGVPRGPCLAPPKVPPSAGLMASGQTIASQQIETTTG